MKITRISGIINLNKVMDISVDVHKDNLNFFFAVISAKNLAQLLCETGPNSCYDIRR